MNIVCLGDSITHAGGCAERDRWPNILQAKLDAWRPGEFAVYNHGVGGDTTAHGLERLQGVLNLMPGVTLVLFAFNDANCRPFQNKPRVGLQEFRANMLSIGALVRRAGGRPVYVLTHPVGPGWGRQGDGKDYARRVAHYNRVTAAVARRLKALCIDVPRRLALRRIPLQTIRRDCVHLSAAGNHALAEIVFAALTENISALTPEAPPTKRRSK